MKLLLFADLHLDTPFTWAEPEVARRRRQSLRDTLSRIVDLAIANEVDAVCSAGDLYEHERVAPDSGVFLRDQFARLGSTRVFLAPGNHDWCGPTSLYRRTGWSANVHVFDEPRLRPVELAPGFTLWGAGHVVPANTPNLLSGFRADRSGVNLGLFHASMNSWLSVQGEGKKPHAPFDEADLAAAGLDHALLGHFHAPRDGDGFTYPGNPDALEFGETGVRGAVLVEVRSDGGTTRTRHVVSTTSCSSLSVDISGCLTVDDVRTRAADALAPLSGVVRVELFGEVAPTLDVDRGMLHGIGAHLDALCVRVGRLTLGYDLGEIAAQPNTVRGRFVLDVLAADLDEDLRRRVIVTGLRALEGRKDLGVS